MEVHILIDLLEVIFINLIMSVDNALIIGIVVRELPIVKRKHVLVWSIIGISSIYIFLSALSILIQRIPYVKLASGLVLIWIATKLIININLVRKNGDSVLQAIKYILIANFFISLDNALVISTLTQGNFLYVIIGIIISVSIVVWTSSFFSTLILKYPSLVYGGAGTLIYLSVLMIMEELHVFYNIFLSLIFTLSILTLGEMVRKRKQI